MVGLGALVLVGCGGGKPPASAAEASASQESALDSAYWGAKNGVFDQDESKLALRQRSCSGGSLDLLNALSEASCEKPGEPLAMETRNLKNQVDVRVVPAKTKVAPGETVEVRVVFTNKSSAGLPLDFRVNPFARFEIQVFDAKGKRVDLPQGPHPAWPANHEDRGAEPRVAEVRLDENGTGYVNLSFAASRTRWAPEKARGAAAGSPYPRLPAGRLPKGKYTLRVVTPLLGVDESPEREMSAPTAKIEVGK
jgi:hypothetical protein